MIDKKIVIGIILISLIILGGGIFLLSQTTSTKPQNATLSQNVKIEAPEKTFDWGMIKYSGDKVTKTFTIKNTGSDPLKLYNIKTSCACTSANLTIDGKISPKFDMHTKSSWVGEVPANKEAILTVIFDQTFHGPTGVGPMERLIFMQTNDLTSPTLEFKLTGNVVKD
ncbi:MAG: DUF1573 domain-containing protein [Candidatus Daviesbacteria bacterium]|nr:DUF1573 domain-containing protein [Candidatus Daviesbacteria bacterium]